MEAIETLRSRMVPLWRADVDTDQIMPKQYLSRIERVGFGPFVFGNWRAEGGFILDDERYAGAEILVAGPNFGCGSSREQAVWGLQDHGFRAVIAPSFGAIFRSNCLRAGLLPITLPEEVCEQLVAIARSEPHVETLIDVDAGRIEVDGGAVSADFSLEPHVRETFLLGLDEIERTLTHGEAISAYEATRHPWLPSTTGA
jgi:3-isopropylmalate/(R)-2-methylmalate dehydratase small subunit